MSSTTAWTHGIAAASTGCSMPCARRVALGSRQRIAPCDIPRGTDGIIELRAGRLHSMKALSRTRVGDDWPARRTKARADNPRSRRARRAGYFCGSARRICTSTTVRCCAISIGNCAQASTGRFSAQTAPARSSFLKLLYGDLSPALGGRIERRGIAAGTPIAAWKRRVGYVSPELQADYAVDVTVLDLVASGRHASIGLADAATAPDRKAAARWIKFFRLRSVADRRPRELSYGQLRRALIARALAGGARILLLDEPLTGLDPRQRAVMKGLLRSADAPAGDARHGRASCGGSATRDYARIAPARAAGAPHRLPFCELSRRQEARACAKLRTRFRHGDWNMSRVLRFCPRCRRRWRWPAATARATPCVRSRASRRTASANRSAGCEEAFGEPRKIETTPTKEVFVWFLPQNPGRRARRLPRLRDGSDGGRPFGARSRLFAVEHRLVEVPRSGAQDPRRRALERLGSERAAQRPERSLQWAISAFRGHFSLGVRRAVDPRFGAIHSGASRPDRARDQDRPQLSVDLGHCAAAAGRSARLHRGGDPAGLASAAGQRGARGRACSA